MIRLENCIERKLCTFSLCEDMWILQGGLNIKGLIYGKTAVTLEWHECISYAGAQDHPCHLTRCMSRSPRQTRSP